MRRPRQEEIDRHWANYFQRDYQRFVEPGIQLQSRSDDSDEVFLFHHGQAALVLVPPAELDCVAALFNDQPPAIAQLADGLDQCFETGRFREIEAGFKFYLDPAIFAPQQQPASRRLGPRDEAQFELLRRNCSEYDWQMSEIQFEQPDITGYFVGETLVAAAAFNYLGEPALIADVHLITHPQYRRRGYGRLLSEDLIRSGLRKQMIVQWDAKSRNTGSISLARSIGFEQYAFMQRLILSQTS